MASPPFLYITEHTVDGVVAKIQKKTHNVHIRELYYHMKRETDG